MEYKGISTWDEWNGWYLQFPIFQYSHEWTTTTWRGMNLENAPKGWLAILCCREAVGKSMIDHGKVTLWFINFSPQMLNNSHRLNNAASKGCDWDMQMIDGCSLELCAARLSVSVILCMQWLKSRQVAGTWSPSEFTTLQPLALHFYFNHWRMPQKTQFNCMTLPW